jgi:murein DD-endopeptidase MepM/ murein hydrolase activator NlpD
VILNAVQPALANDLIWPLDCRPGDGTCYENLGYPDVDGDGLAYNCQQPGYTGHEGTDISLTSYNKIDESVSVFAAAAGKVLWVFDGKYDRCPDADEPDCQAPPDGWFEAGQSNGYRVCTEVGDYCDTGSCCCYWCFDGGNVVIIKHDPQDNFFITRYDHLKTNSILVEPGDSVIQGQKIAEVGSSGHSTGPHLHFEVWGEGYYNPVEPWAGSCGPNFDKSLWEYNPPWPPDNGDVNNDGSVGLDDVVMSLQVCTNTTVEIDKRASVQQNEQIGIPEALYGLEKMAEEHDN